MLDVEHRRERRVPVLLPVKLYYCDGDEVARGLARNVSRNGMYVELADSLPTCGLLQIAIPTPAGDPYRAVRLLAAVTHAAGRGVGLEIFADSPDERAVLEALVESASEMGSLRVG